MVLRTGDLAYYDSFAGMIPCKVTAITGTSGIASTAQRVTLTVTASQANCCGRSAYKRGEQIETNGIHAVPRKAHYHGSCGIGRIRAYTVTADPQ